ncbi:sodium:proton antiporter [Robiginitalea sp. SC105]|uniref:cation:proton antiporter n=1 Tax=Robiginitalea sp. SC105 TaxID=2762332 RepID=UPI00163A8F9B|nr:sodium:proton antiporter [Robiginitalea sp. SC105]MBC2839331.1 sodium:proton antiporter [Robiginitalea sp. SC105]
MDYFVITTVLVLFSALFGYLNTRFVKLPNTIGLTVITIAFTLGVFALSAFDSTLLEAERYILSQIDFRTVLLDLMLGFLLFAGALHTDLEKLKEQKWPVLLFATFGVLVSTFLIGGATFFVLGLVGLEVPFIYCLLFGSLISPTDPIAVLGILKKVGAPEKLEIKIVGESLFNDGVGVVVFLTLFGMAAGGWEAVSVTEILSLFLLEVFGGLLLGIVMGWITYRMMRTIDEYDIEVILTLAMVMTGMVLAQYLHVSGPLAMVAAGLMIGGTHSRNQAMSETVELYVDKFWELIDILLNTILFVLVGMEMLVLEVETEYVIAGVMMIPIALVCRHVSLYLPIKIYEKRLNFVKHTHVVMTWGGLRGAISIALALSLAEDMYRDLFLVVTYIVVIFSIIVQGLSVGALVSRLRKWWE